MDDNTLDFIGFLVDKTYEDVELISHYFSYDRDRHCFSIIVANKTIEIPITWQYLKPIVDIDLTTDILDFSQIFINCPELKDILNLYFNGNYSYDNLINYSTLNDQDKIAA